MPDHGPIRSAFTAANAAGEATRSGTCASCGSSGPAVDTMTVLSGNFGDWDRMPWRRTGLLCEACAWVFGGRAWRLYPHIVTAAPSIQRAAPSALRAVLTAGAVPADVAVSVPVGGKRHVAPWMTWGQVVSDAGRVPWAAADAAALIELAALRARGYGEQALAEPAPPWPLLRRDSEMRDTLARWSACDRLRGYPPALDVALRATRKDKA